ncbi:alpha/beta fold hydrolase [Aureibaculum conchae]|uniref:alpha/beta fold hydrolase n=1 Tax=Aureibaculum sp. 2308TA14-22 TaxID=3108392 RepID=UPI0033948611
MKRKSTKIILSIILILVSITILVLLIISHGKTSVFKDAQGKKLENSIAEMKYVKIGGINQFILIRGENKKNPILLILHGGPGTSELPLFRKYNSFLEKHYTVVQWDQRGAGKSYSENIPISCLSVDQLIQDTHELTNYLKIRFNQHKIFILGHSWGSYLGLSTVHKYPDDYYAFIGTGQMTNQSESEKLSFNYVMNKAKEQENAIAIKELNEIGEYNLSNLNKIGIANWFEVQRKWLLKFNGIIYNSENYFNLIYLPYIFNREYTLSDKLSIFKGSKISIDNMFPTVLTTNLKKTIKELGLPIYILQGAYDYTTSYNLAKEYFDMIEAPKKKFITFEKSSHNPAFEEPEKFNQIMIKEVLGENFKLIE